MSLSYDCYRCFYKTNQYANIIRHINKKKQCSKTIDSYKYSDDQILILSILPHYSNKVSIKDEEIKKYEKSNILHLNKEDLLNNIADINKNGIKKCKFCNKDFDKSDDLKKHILLNCFIEELNKKNQNNNINILNNNSHNIKCNNITNSNNNFTNNININFEIKPPIPFYEEWDLSEFTINDKNHHIFQKSMYTTLLDKILENKSNLNVIIEDINQETALVYKDHIDKYKEIKIDDIVLKTMEKLKKHLIEMSEDCFNKCYNETFELALEQNISNIKKKYSDYKFNNNNIKQHVNTSISQVYKKNKDNAIEKMNSIIKKIEDNGY
jgi:hypothetical protein